MYVIFASYGNDSIALIQWAKEHKLKNVFVVYSNTGWAAPWWPARVRKAENWVRSIGFKPVRITSEGMRKLVERKQWPRGGGGKYQFCTAELKIKPALTWLGLVDPDKEAVCMVGIRREESPNRAGWPEHVYESENHGGRELWSPLVRMLASERDQLIYKSPFIPLDDRSKECWPCVNARKKTLANLSEKRISVIRSMEQAQGFNSKGNPIVMFSPKRHKGAIGIDAVVAWAHNATEDEIEQAGCDGGWCGT